MLRQSDAASKLCGACAPILIVLVCWLPLYAGSDIWAHAAVGRWIVRHAQIPHTALFLWSYTGSWTPHSWLAEIGTYAVMRACGDLGGSVVLVALSAIAVIAAFAIVLWPVAKKGALAPLPAVMFLLALTAATPRFQARPEIFTTLFTALLCSALVRLEDPRAIDMKRLAWIPVLFVFWTNVHGGVLFGLVCLWLFAFCNSVQDRMLSRLVPIAVLSTLAMFVNPFGIGYLRVFAPLAHQSFTYIDEWLPFWRAPVVRPGIPLAELGLLIGAFSAWLLAPRRRLAEIALLALGSAAFLSARRNMDLMALMCLVVFSGNYALAAQSAFIEALRGRALYPKASLAASVLVGAYFIFLVFACTGCVLAAPFVKTTVGRIPSNQASVIAMACPSGMRILNLYDSAAYLEWRLGEQHPLFIDGMNAYPNSVYDDWVQIWNATPRGLALLNADKIGCVVGGPRVPGRPIEPLYGYLIRDKSWRLLYVDSEGPVFVKQGMS